MKNLFGILGSEYFLWGFGLGLVCLLAVVWAHRSERSAKLVGVGGLVAALSLAAVMLAEEFYVTAVIGIALIFLLVAVVRSIDLPFIWEAAAAVPGTVVLALAAPSEPGWARLVIIGVAPMLGLAIRDFDQRHRDRGLGLVFSCLAIVGVFLVVPDTEWIRALVAVCIPVVFTTWPRVMAWVGPTGAFMMAGVVALYTVTGGLGRHGSIVGAFACFGFVIVEPIAVRINPSVGRWLDGLRRVPSTTVLLAVPQLLVVLIASRVIGRYLSPVIALASAVGLLVAAAGLLIWASASSPATAETMSRDR